MESSGEGHVLRAGDCSFNNLGVTTYFMLSSTMPQELLAEKGYHPVGGCGGNIAWHTEDDTMEIADRDNLLRDMRVYAATILRSLNAPVAPFDYRATLDEIATAVDRYSAPAAGVIDFEPTREATANLRTTLDAFYAQTASIDPNDAAAVRAANATQRAIARSLVTLCYTRDGRFQQDPARAIPAVPDLAYAEQLPDADASMRHVITNQLRRGQNRVIWELDQLRSTVEESMG
jgi:hypothetical protein